jgi:hypothetical protein
VFVTFEKIVTVREARAYFGKMGRKEKAVSS